MPRQGALPAAVFRMLCQGFAGKNQNGKGPRPRRRPFAQNCIGSLDVGAWHYSPMILTSTRLSRLPANS
jgi:hypothetical protein